MTRPCSYFSSQNVFKHSHTVEPHAQGVCVSIISIRSAMRVGGQAQAGSQDTAFSADWMLLAGSDDLL